MKQSSLSILFEIMRKYDIYNYGTIKKWRRIQARVAYVCKQLSDAEKDTLQKTYLDRVKVSFWYSEYNPSSFKQVIIISA